MLGDMTADRPSIQADGMSLVAAVVAMLALIGTLFGVGLGMRAVDETKNKLVSATESPAAPVAVHLKEFAISPNAIQAGAGSAVLSVTNDGTVPHNLRIVGQSLITPDISPGQTAKLDVSKLPAGAYKIQCDIPGHASAGMTGTLTLTAGGAGTSGMAMGTTATTAAAMTADQMDAAMTARTKAFPAKTEGLGAQLMEPTVVDGVKVYELTTSVVKWEVEPGKFVDAWAYNGVVPGPTIHVSVGDKVRVVLHNQLPESTTIHFHGVKVPNAMDGVPDITQPAVKPGQSFTYEFTAQEPAVGMYHSHYDAAKQVANGLAGAFLVGEMPLPQGVTVSQEIPMVLNDAGTIGYSLNGKSFPATAPVVATQGDWVEVQYFNEGTQIHPMHLHGMPVTIIAKDGLPLATPEQDDTVMVAPGERYTILIHATELGTWAWHCHILPHAESETGMFGMVTALVVKPA
jgi:uncharacterized cupredoxin-like copper-binding protein